MHVCRTCVYFCPNLEAATTTLSQCTGRWISYSTSGKRTLLRQTRKGLPSPKEAQRSLEYISASENNTNMKRLHHSIQSQPGIIQQKIELETIGRAQKMLRLVKQLGIMLLGNTCRRMFGQTKGTCHAKGVS